ncbi:RNA-binding protein [Mycoplasma bovis]|uniref:RNA-binding S4 domain-containing protein n=3 Tax=Mycoplasmopsis bovis TaxID=28903 RepID=UPI000E106B19|nr:RNA-binding S4 domain-containing protein [Mycoplasmopsis bovis]AXJ68886.1 RNA-binding protein [Mycoplasmopsis bovis]AXJ69665.1 RNA-binding protein [Mycoplasmopsis bovis]AXJ70435.1 RNA-binding protein [Mycoplasmopsis bovis]AXJ71273.1 RNA-binding protein [Mycoplasmopsis bovis]AXJ72128.1 RNA-binding protein [Mycoplasmopsis bovis]
MKPEIYIKDDFITIGQLLKKIGLIQTGGGAKFYLESNKVLINNKKPEGRNTKVKNGDLLIINSNIFIVKKETVSD